MLCRMPLAGLCLELCRALSFSGDAGVVREEEPLTTIGVPVVPEHLLQVLGRFPVALGIGTAGMG